MHEAALAVANGGLKMHECIKHSYIVEQSTLRYSGDQDANRAECGIYMYGKYLQNT